MRHRNLPCGGPFVRVSRGFARAEALAAMLVTMGIVSIVMIAGGESRRQARLGEDIAKLRGFGAATSSYGADHQDLLWSFSWQGGVAYNTPYPELNLAPDDVKAQANQAIYILRTHGGVPEATPLSNWIANIQYSHFVLAEHFDRPLPDFEAISSADKLRLQWAQHPDGTGQGLYGPYACTADPIHCKTRPRSASFRLVVAAYDGSAVGSRISPASSASWFTPSSAHMGGRPLAEISHPAHKVLMSDAYARHFGQAVFCTADQARLPILFGDGSASVRATVDSNPGWQPNSPTSSLPSTFNCSASAWEPCGGPATFIGRFLWTRGCPNNMLAGRDFGAPEVCLPPP